MFFFFFNEDVSTVIIADIKNSRKISNRDEVQKQLFDTLEYINIKFHNDIKSNFTITLGDEFQGVLKNGEHLIRIILEIERKMRPIEFRFGIGIGKITTDINPSSSIGADGPGYYLAREAIQEVQRNESKREVSATNIKIQTDEENGKVSELVNTVFTLLNAIRMGWNENQNQIADYMILDNRKQAELVPILGLKQSSINRSIKRSNLYAYMKAMQSIEGILKEVK